MSGLAGCDHDAAAVEIGEVEHAAEGGAVVGFHGAGAHAAAAHGTVAAILFDAAFDERAEQRHEAQQRMGEDGLMRGTPAPSRLIRAEAGGEGGDGVAVAFGQQPVAVLAELRAGGEGLAQQIGPGGGGCLGCVRHMQFGEQHAVGLFHPGLEDQRLRAIAVHAAVPGGEFGGDAAQAGEEFGGDEVEIIALHAHHVGQCGAGGGVQHLADAAGAGVAIPVAAELDGEIGRGDAFIAVDDAAGGGGDVMGQGVA